MLLIGWRKFACFSLAGASLRASHWMTLCACSPIQALATHLQNQLSSCSQKSTQGRILEAHAHHLLNMNKYQFKFYIFSMDSALHVMEFLEQIYLAAALHYRIWILYTYMDVLGKMNRKGVHKRQNLLSSSSPALSAGVNIYPTLPSCRSERDTLKAINSQGTKTVLGLYSTYIYMRL